MAHALLFQLDGKVPNIALMRIAAHHRQRGDSVELRWTGDPNPDLLDYGKTIYASAIFEKTMPAVRRLKAIRPDAIVGGTGVSLETSLESIGISELGQDYSLYPKWQQSIGFTQRGCRLKCPFCVVPKKEGKMRPEKSIYEIWRGPGFPKKLILLDNDFFGQPQWRERIKEIREGDFKASFNQGINARFLTDEAAEAISSIKYRDDSMEVKRIYTAWDNLKDEERLFAGLNRLVKYGVKPDEIMVYMLIDYWPGETEEGWLERVKKLQDFGARPYPMPFWHKDADGNPTRSTKAIGFQRWVIRRYYHNVSWDAFKAADFRPEKLEGGS